MNDNEPLERYLFRGRRLDNQEWIQGGLVYASNSAEFMPGVYIMQELYTVRYEPKRNQMMLGGFIEVDPATVGMWTGLTDKNSVRIFEGDIVSFCFPEDGIYCRGKCTGTVIFDGLRYTTDCCMLDWLDERFEVIGSIHGRKDGSN